MGNQTDIKGNNNIVIQGVTDSSITLNVNGETREIKNELVELKALLKKIQVQNFQFAQNNYNIEDITESNFGFVTQKKTFNQLLTRHLTEALEPYSKPAARLLAQATKVSKDWETQSRISDKAKEVIAYSFVGVLGLQLQKLMAIGKEDISTAKLRSYIENCLLTTKRGLQLLSYILISKLWDEKMVKKIELSQDQVKNLTNFFEAEFGMNIEGLINLIEELYALFKKHKLKLPLPELKNFEKQLDPASDFMKSCQKFQELNDKFDQSKYSLLDCFEAEQQLVHVLEALVFLAGYKMVSIKSISYDEMRNMAPRFLHHYTTLGIDSRSNINSERINYAENAVTTDAILFYNESYEDSINLFPFIIDYNSLTQEEGSKIALFECMGDLGKSLEYRYLKDNDKQLVSFDDTLKKSQNNYADLIKDDKKYCKYKLDNVFLKLQEAKSIILTTESIDLDDIFEGEEDT